MCNNNFFGNASNCWIIMLVLLLLLGCGGGCAGNYNDCGCGCGCQGCWKAYTNLDQAQRVFALYQKCREVYTRCFLRGFSVSRLTVAA